jgi:RNA polymerase sigma-70 factor (ECF subfamily)
VTGVGDPASPSAEELYRDLGPAVLGYLRAQGVDEPEDLLGDVFLQVTRDLERFRGDAAQARRWVFAIAHNRMVDHHRRRRRRPRTVPASSAPEPVDDGDLDEHLVDPDLVAALARLTRDQRDVVVLRFVADLSVADVAHLLRRRTGAVKALQARALANLGVALADPPGGPR